MSVKEEKATAGRAAVAYVEDGMTVGLGTGTTVACFLPALAEQKLSIRCVATSPATFTLARSLGLDVEPFTDIARLDLAVDGADQVSPEGWLVKGGGGAHTREKIVAAAAERFVVIVSSEKLVPVLSCPIPLELLEFGIDAAIASLGDVRRRHAPSSPDGGVIADWFGTIGDPSTLATRLSSTPGVIEHGLFPPALVSDVVVGTSSGAQLRTYRN